MLDDLRGAEILRGVRGQPGADVDAIVSLLETVAGIAATHPEIAEMDLNPVSRYNTASRSSTRESCSLPKTALRYRLTRIMRRVSKI